MKRRLYILLTLLTLVVFAVFLPACEADADSSVKELSKPYIAQYECVEARLGDEDLLEHYEYIRIILVNKDKMQVVIKPEDGDKKVVEGSYTFDFDTRELEGEIGIMGCRFKEKTVVGKGGFDISKTILGKQLYIKFKII